MNEITPSNPSSKVIDNHFFLFTTHLFAGLYLYLLVVETFSRIEVINKFAVYAIIGYGMYDT